MKNKIESLQVVRAIAFLGIFASHSGLISFWACGKWGVSVFFILSGFLMYYSYSNTNRIKENGVAYCVKFGIGKIKKLYPLHIATMLLALPLLIVEYVNNSCSEKITVPLLKMILNVKLTQSWVPKEDYYFSLNVVAWYLSTSLFLYMMFPLILRFMKKYKSIKIAVIMLASAYALQVILAYSCHLAQNSFINRDGFTQWFVYIFPVFRLFDFIIGCNLGYIFMNIKTNKQASDKKYTFLELCIFIIIIIQFAIVTFTVARPSAKNPLILTNNWWASTVFWTISSCALVFLFALNKGKISKMLTKKPLMYIANISAYAFLIHQILFRYLRIFERSIFGRSIEYIDLIVCFTITIVCSYLWDKITKHVGTKKSES